MMDAVAQIKQFHDQRLGNAPHSGPALCGACDICTLLAAIDAARRESALDAAEVFGETLAKASIRAEEDIAAASRDGAREAWEVAAKEADKAFERVQLVPNAKGAYEYGYGDAAAHLADDFRFRAAVLEREEGQPHYHLGDSNTPCWCARP